MAATADWHPLGKAYYKKSEVYTLDWDDLIDVSKFVVSAAPYGGPLALMRDDSNNPNIAMVVKPIITVYTAAGKKISQMRWNSGKIKDLGWSQTEDLLFVQDDGTILIYDLFLSFKKVLSMGQEAKDVKVIDARIFSSFNGTGIAVLTSSYRIFMMNSIDDPRVQRLAEVPGLQSAPTSWTILTMDRQSQVLVAKDSELYLIDRGGQYQKQMIDISTPVEGFIEMAVSFNNKCIALFTESGVIWIGSADLKKKYCEFNTKCHQKPQQLVWCGPGAVVALWDKQMLVIGPDKDYISFMNDTPVHLVEEEDGIRIIGNFTHEFLHRVQKVTEDIFKIASMEPGAMLYEAFKEFQKESQRADEYIRSIKDNLELAVSQCIQAAGYELEPSKQRQLLRAAAFGKSFLTDYNPEPFVNMCQMLRVLNQVCHHTIGIPLTYSQLHHLTMPVLIDRLVLRKFFYLAIRICQYLKIQDSEGASRILAHWACYKVQQKQEDDEMIARAIADKLGDTPGVSYSDIASKALECGRTDLAIRLLDYEPKAAHQVPLLLQMQKEQLALSKAIESGDTDLVYFVLLRLKESMIQGEFFMAIRNLPVAYYLYLQYCRQQNKELMEQLYYQEDNYLEEGNSKILRSFTVERYEERMTIMKEAMDSYNKARNEFAARQTEEQIKLAKYQRRLEEELKRPYMDLSLHQTIYRLIMDNNVKMPEILRKEFKVPDKRFWWLKIQALAEAGEWMELDRFSKAKKPPIGMEAFVEVCLKNGNKHEAMKYIIRVSPDKKVKCLIKMGEFKMAAETAFENRNEEELNSILRRCIGTDRQVAETINSMKQQLSSKK
ncbi:hypothetical protein CHS0354_017895 [Potamilus streckersoni]|uniref:Vacuolar protein sorting-associated protein 16 homolog n=1 Tax=Potamilus streckersoni TaxID=2493646 RepID=A0AAE0T3H5_9BIVA|nr:hypothetical protein CHS0354_017895 [Potamilus streckersoni]